MKNLARFRLFSPLAIQSSQSTKRLALIAPLNSKALFISGPRQYQVDVAGDSSQQRGLATLCGPRRQERLNIKVRAQLVLQDEEPQVLVSVNGQQIGHLSRANGQALHRIVRYGERSPHLTFECAGLIYGTAPQLGVRLDLPLDD